MQGKQLAERLGVSDVTVSRWLSGSMLPPLSRRRVYERILGLPPGWFDDTPGSQLNVLNSVGSEPAAYGAVRESQAEYPEPEPPLFETQLPDEEMIERMAHGRADFVRGLQKEFADLTLTRAAKLGRLEFLVRLARERGRPVDEEFVAGLRTVIEKGGLG